MKLGNPFRENWRGIGDWALTTWDNLISALQGAWKVEHTDDDRHGHVHAQSLQVGRVSYSDILAVQPFSSAQINNFNDSRLRDAGLLRVSTSGIFEVSLTGIQVPVDELGNIIDGRVLVIENISETGIIALEHQNDNSSPANRFIVPMTFSTATGFTARYFLLPNTVTTLVYNADRARWIVYSRNTDELQSYAEFGSNQNDYAPPGWRPARVARLSATAANLTISGFSSTDIPAPSRKLIINEGLYTFAILHMNTGSSAGNRVQCPSGSKYYVHPRESVELYRDTDGTWHIALKADQWIDVAYNAGNFVPDAGTWTVDAGDVDAYQYQIDGNKMTVNWRLINTNIAGGPPTVLSIAIPAGRVCARTTDIPFNYMEGGPAYGVGLVQIAAGGVYIDMYKSFGAPAWAAGAAHLAGQVTFMVETSCGTVSEAHQDTAHGDTAHTDGGHSDIAHIDVAHSDSHSDVAHSDTAHGDTAHSDVAFQDVAHSDSAHGDAAHDDTHSDVAHQDGHNDVHDDFTDSFTDGPVHSDSAHTDFHTDTHDDSAHSDTHTDGAHSDVAHSDVAHADVAHADVAHSDGGHADVAHLDTHTDTAHSDTAHADSAHSDTAHIDTPHTDVGLHCDTAHSDI